MLHADERDELRALQARAYGRDGGLSRAETRRLHELTGRRAGVRRDEEPVLGTHEPVVAPNGTVTNGAVPEGPAEESADEPFAVLFARDADEAELPPAEGSAPQSHRSPRRPAIVAAFVAALIVALIVGFGAGWMLFGQKSAPSIALSAEQQQRQADVASEGDYDDGSLRALAQQDDVLLWSATKGGGALTCLVIGNPETTGASCRTTELVRPRGLSLTLTQVGEQGSGQITGQLLLSPGDEPAAALSFFRYNTDADGLETTYANEDEERFADSLAAEGFDRGSAQVVGYDGENPIWTALRADEGSQCLIYSEPPVGWQSQCTEAAEEGVSLQRDDSRTEETMRVVWKPTASDGTSLEITKTGSVGDAAGG